MGNGYDKVGENVLTLGKSFGRTELELQWPVGRWEFRLSPHFFPIRLKLASKGPLEMIGLD